MSDDSALFSISLVWVALLLVVTASLALTAGIAIGSGGFPDDSGGGDDGDQAAELVGLQTREPRCGTHRSSNSSAHFRSVDGQYHVSINETVPVAARDSELTADVDEVGDRRYLLDLQRTAGNRSTDCYLEVRYNVTVSLPDRNRYTLIRTVDRTYHALEYGDRNSGGSSGSNLDPRPPSMNDSEWAQALNASDEYAEDHPPDRASDPGADAASGVDSLAN